MIFVKLLSKPLGSTPFLVVFNSYTPFGVCARKILQEDNSIWSLLSGNVWILYNILFSYNGYKVLQLVTLIFNLCI